MPEWSEPVSILLKLRTCVRHIVEGQGNCSSPRRSIAMRSSRWCSPQSERGGAARLLPVNGRWDQV